jgi:N-acetylneuraminate synthase
MTRELKLGDDMVGWSPAYIIAGVGINHNGDLGIARQMIDAAVHAGRRRKISKTHTEIATPPDQQSQMRETPGLYYYLESV